MFRAVVAAAEAQDEGTPAKELAVPLVLAVTGAVGGAVYGCKLNRSLGGPRRLGAAAGYFVGGLVGSVLAMPFVPPGRRLDV